MRGKLREDLTNEELLKFMETHGVKEAADYFNIPITTIYTRLQQLDYFPFNNKLELTEENIKYIEEHKIKESAKHFKKCEPTLRNIITLHKLDYKHCDRVEPFYATDEYKKRIERKHLFLKLHKTMNMEDIAKKYGITKASVSQIINLQEVE